MTLPDETAQLIRRATASARSGRRRFSTPGCAASRPPSAVLGPDHPLTRAIHTLERVRSQSLMVRAMLAASVVVLGARSAWAAAAASAISATIVLVSLGIVAAATAQRRRRLALDLILEGRENLPVAVVRHERQRLQAPRTQRWMACTIESMIEDAVKPASLLARDARPLFNRRIVASVARDLWTISRLLRTEDGRGQAFSRQPPRRAAPEAHLGPRGLSGSPGPIVALELQRSRERSARASTSCWYPRDRSSPHGYVLSSEAVKLVIARRPRVVVSASA
jgi:hypothetical protein